MQIQWKGQACFFIAVSRSRQDQVRVVIDPYENSLGLRLPALEADIALVTHEHYDHSNAAGLKGTPFVITAPGEYEVRDVFIQGIPSWHDGQEGAERGANIIYTLEAEDLRLCHLGDFGQQELTPSQLEQIGEVDVLFVPVGGVYTIDAKQASHIVSQVEPKIAVPMHYALPNIKLKLEGVEKFLKAMGVEKAEPQQKLVLKQKDLQHEGTQVVVMEP